MEIRCSNQQNNNPQRSNSPLDKGQGANKQGGKQQPQQPQKPNQNPNNPQNPQRN